MADKKVNRPSAGLAKLNKDRLRILLAHGYKGIKVDGSWGPYQLKLWDKYTSTNEDFKRALLHNDMQVKYWKALNEVSDAQISLWDDYPQYRLPFILDKAVTLKGVNPRYRGATFSTNMLDSLYKDVNYDKKDFDTALALFGNETMFGKGRMRFKNYDVLPYLTKDNSTSNWQGTTETEALSNWQLLMGNVGLNSLYANIDKILENFNSKQAKDSPELSIPTQPLTRLDSITLQKGIDMLSRQNSYMKEHPLTESPIKNLVDLYNKNPELLNPGAPNYVPLIEKTKQELNLEPAIIEWKRKNFKSDGGFMFEEDPPTAPKYPDVPTKEAVLAFLKAMDEYRRLKALTEKSLSKNLILPNGEELQRYADETDGQYEDRYKTRLSVYNQNAERANKRFESRQLKIDDIVRDVNNNIGLVAEAPKAPFTGEAYKEAAEYERQKEVNKAHDYKNIFDATLTVAELGMSGASLLGAYANWKKWKDLASLTNPTTAQLAKARIANLLLKALLPMLIGGTGIDAYLTYDALNNDDTPNTIYNGISMGLGALGSVGASDVFLNSRFHSPKIDRILDVLGITLNTGDFLKLGYDTYNSITKDDNKKATGGPLSTPLDWNELSMKEKAQYIRMGVSRGYKDIDSIKNVYNEFRNGGNLYGIGGTKGNKSTKRTPSVPQVTLKVIDYFTSKGLTDYQAAGLVGNFIRESLLNPEAINKYSGAYGIAQWLGPRKEALFKKYGEHPTLDLLLDFVWQELNSTHKSGLNNLKLSKNALEAARNAMGYYEFQAGPEGAIRAMNKSGQNGQASMDEGIRNAHNIMMNVSPDYRIEYKYPGIKPSNIQYKDITLPNDAIPLFKYNGLTEYDKSFIVDDETLNKIMNSLSNNTTLDTNIPFQQVALVENVLPEVTVTPEEENHYYIKPNPQQLLALMNSMMVPYEPVEVPKPLTATERLAKLAEDRNTLLLQDLEDSILRANRLGTPIDDVKLARDVRDLQFYRNIAADGGNLFLKGGPLVDAANRFGDGGDKILYTNYDNPLDEVVVTAPRKYIARYDEDGNPIYTIDPNLSMSAEVPLTQEEIDRQQALIDIKNRPAGQLTGTADVASKVAQMGIGAALAPLAVAPVIEGVVNPLVEAATTVTPTVMPWIKGAMELGVRPTSTIVKGLSSYVPQVSKAVPYFTGLDKTAMGMAGLFGMKDAYEGYKSGNKHWANALAEGALSGMMATELSPAVKYANKLAGRGFNLAARGFDWVARKVYAPYDFYRTIQETTPRTTPTLYGFPTSDLTGSNFVKTTYTGSPLFEFGQTIRTSPEKAYFMRAPKDVDILKLKNGRFRHEVVGNEILPSGEVNGKFVSYGEPWQEFALGENSALYEFPVGPRRGPGLMATDWKGRPQKYSVDEIYDYMQREEALNRGFRKDVAELGLDKLKGAERIKAYRALKEEKYPELLEGYDTSIYGANQTVIPNERWNFDRFLKTPFWKYSENPLSGQVQKELVMRWPEAKPLETPTLNWADDAKKTPTITPGNAVNITPEQWTAAQDVAIAKGDMVEAQRLRDLHFKISTPNNKYNGHAYHNTNTQFNEFKPEFIGKTDSGYYGEGFYFTPNKTDANNVLGPIQKDVYIYLKNPREITASDYISGPLINNDGAIVRNGKEGWITLDGTPPPDPNEVMEVVSNIPSRIKSADAVTYDNNGVRIPLGKRDNFNINDIRYSWLPWLLGGTTAGYLYNKTQQ